MTFKKNSQNVADDAQELLDRLRSLAEAKKCEGEQAPISATRERRLRLIDAINEIRIGAENIAANQETMACRRYTEAQFASHGKTVSPDDAFSTEKTAAALFLSLIK